MKNRMKYLLVALVLLAFGLATACSGGPSICDCANPMNATQELVEKCAKKFGDLSPREIQEKYQKECN